jgi:hypothetical protein
MARGNTGAGNPSFRQNVDTNMIVDGTIVDDDIAADGIAADATGRGVFATDLFNEATVDDVFAAGAIDDDRLKALSTTRKLGGRDLGRACVGYFYLTGAAGDTELVTINSRTYEFDTNATSTGDVAVDISGDATADAAITALVTAINADVSAVVEAVAWAGNNDTTAGVSLIANTAQATNYTLTTDAANGVVSAATLAGAAVIANRDLWAFSYTVTSADVTAWARSGGNEVAIAGVTSTTAPTIVGFLIRDSSNVCKSPANLTLKATQANSNFYALIVEDGITLLAASDVITCAVVI